MNILFFEYKNFGKEDIIDAFNALGHQVTSIEDEEVFTKNSRRIDQIFEKETDVKKYDFIFTLNI
jgi:hypothetical protein